MTSVSGFLTKPGLGVWSTAPDGSPPLLADLGGAAAAATAEVRVVATHDGPVEVAAYTVTYDGMGPVALVALADTADGTRVIARSDDDALIDRALDDGLVGVRLQVSGNRLT